MAPYIGDTLCFCAPTSLPSTADRWYDHTAVCRGRLECSCKQNTAEDCIIVMNILGCGIANYFTRAEGVADGLDAINSEIKSEYKYVIIKLTNQRITNNHELLL